MQKQNCDLKKSKSVIPEMAFLSFLMVFLKCLLLFIIIAVIVFVVKVF